MNASIRLNLKVRGKNPVNSKKNKNQPSFTIKIKELLEALESSYMGIGTPYQPIPVDNFINLENQEYATIHPRTQITAYLSWSDSTNTLVDMQMVCCKVTNIDRRHNDDLKGNPGNPWSEFFKLKRKSGKRLRTIYPAPDGTLYVGPKKNGKCCINTCKKVPDAILAYSMIFSATVQFDNDNQRSYYFVLDPVIKVSSNPPR